MASTVEYQIVKSMSPERLVERVNWQIKRGWLPMGGVGIYGGANFQAHWYQAMVRQITTTESPELP